MKQQLHTDTIAAIATAPGLGGIGIIRISGAGALEVLRAMFSRKGRTAASGNDSGKTQAATENVGRAPVRFEPRRLEYGWVLDASGSPLDEVLAVYMPGPRTFSGEDVVEIHCHGGRAVMDAVLESALARGARLAGPGEFTRRAFLNGRLDLSQAEAVAEMIAAPSLEGVYLARNKLEGRLGQSLEAMRAELDWLRARLYLAIDFPDDAEDEFDGGESAEAVEFRTRLDGLLVLIERLILACERARVWREGAEAALAGQVNVGKSSLLNALLGRRRALVSDTPGTTRDFIEETVNLAGLPVRLVDTAGLRSTGRGSADEIIEAEGMNLAREVFARADAILLVIPADRIAAALSRLSSSGTLDCVGPEAGWHKLDSVWAGLLAKCGEFAADGEAAEFDVELAAAGLSREDIELLRGFGAGGPECRLVLIVNKIDLHEGLLPPASMLGCPCFGVSARSGAGLDELGAGIKAFITGGSGALDFASEAAPNMRQSEKLKEVRFELETLKADYSGRIPADLLSVRLDTAAAYLSEVIGESGTEEVLDRVFSSFCIGK